jgi:hypothetical protein
VTINRTQALVIGFVVLAWLSLLGILIAAPDVLDATLRLPLAQVHVPGLLPATTYGVERAYMSAMVYCLQYMEEIARRKSSARTLRRVFKLDEPARSRPVSPRGDHYR